jgi:hypothetical protein
MSEGAKFDDAARKLASEIDRRRALSLAGASLLGMIAFVKVGDDTAAAKNPKCKKRARKCRIQNSAYCAANYPSLYNNCFAALSYCCSFVGKCKMGSYYSCVDFYGW